MICGYPHFSNPPLQCASLYPYTLTSTAGSLADTCNVCENSWVGTASGILNVSTIWTPPNCGWIHVYIYYIYNDTIVYHRSRILYRFFIISKIYLCHACKIDLCIIHPEKYHQESMQHLDPLNSRNTRQHNDLLFRNFRAFVACNHSFSTGWVLLLNMLEVWKYWPPKITALAHFRAKKTQHFWWVPTASPWLLPMAAPGSAVGSARSSRSNLSGRRDG